MDPKLSLKVMREEYYRITVRHAAEVSIRIWYPNVILIAKLIHGSKGLYRIYHKAT